MKTIIASADQKESILRNLASVNNGILEGVQVLTISAALKEEKNDDILLTMQLRELLAKDIDSFAIYGKMFSFPSFLNEILSFTKECILYQITPSLLPETNANEKELKRIIETALTLDLAEKENILHHDLRETDITLHYQFIKDPYHYDLFEAWKKKYPYESYPQNHPSVSLRYTLSAREEAEAVAQDISKHERPCNIILTSSSQLPLYESVLQRYQIPFTSLKEEKPLHIPLIFKTLIELGVCRDRDSFLNALKYNAFSKQIDPDVYAFFCETCTGTSMPEDIETNTDIFQREVRQYHELSQKAKEYYASIEEDLNSLIHCEKNELVRNAFEILRKADCLSDPSELKAAASIRQTIMESYDHLNSDEDLLFLAGCLESLHASEHISQSDFCTITDLTHPVEPREISYVVSCSGNNYPGVPVKEGLFDEIYVEKIRNYPQQETRHNMYISQIQWIENSATDTLIYSHYTNDYQGREVQFAFEIESRYPKEEKWKLVSLAPYKQKDHCLTVETARALFETDGKTTGSISTIERYFSCAYAYFIASGLRIRKKDIPSLDNANIGSIQHRLLENSVRQHGKSYASLSRDEVDAFLKDAFDLLKDLHPKEIDLIDLSRQRLIDSLMISLSFLNDFEANTSFEPRECEYRFLEDITDTIHLNGVIDRIDQYRNEMFRIIDYKSSLHTLSEDKVKAGVQLQLLTYLIIAERKFHLKPAGAYYFSLKEESYTVEAKKVSYGKLYETEWDEASEKARMFNKRKLSGWKFEDRDTESDASGTHIKNTKALYDYALVEECIIQLYDLFHERLLQGDIALDPTADACMFCDYKSICRFHGEKRKTEAVVMQEVSLKGKE